ncbi:MAG TPA: hypothetical protein VKE70_18880 [Candidatus Solibacter sp.]|nr:hypothetical protein [Candidatus Solibacter sp.]
MIVDGAWNEYFYYRRTFVLRGGRNRYEKQAQQKAHENLQWDLSKVGGRLRGQDGPKGRLNSFGPAQTRLNFNQDFSIVAARLWK